MDIVFAQAVTKIIKMPEGTQRLIGKALLDGATQPDLPVIEFTVEEEKMIEEGLADLEAGRSYSQSEMEVFYDELRAKSYAAI